MNDTPEFMTHERIMTGEEYVSYSDYLSLQRERNEARHEIEGWKNKWECAVEMAAKAEVKRDEAREEIKILRLEAQREAEHHDRLVKELENLYDKLKS